MALPQHTRMLVERLLERYCGRHCPPAFERQVRLDFSINGDTVLLQELRPVFGVCSMLRRVDLARFRFRPRDGSWRLDYRLAQPGSWHAYPGASGRAFLHLLAEVDADPRGLFWGRVNGASLRWCSSRGRCPGCEERYRAVLGPAATNAATAATTPASASSSRWPSPAV